MNISDSENCKSEISIGWLYTRTVWNFIAIIVDILMMNLLCKKPGLLSGCFDKLYMCAFVADFMANIARVVLKYFPTIFCEYHFISILQERIVSLL